MGKRVWCSMKKLKKQLIVLGVVLAMIGVTACAKNADNAAGGALNATESTTGNTSPDVGDVKADTDTEEVNSNLMENVVTVNPGEASPFNNGEFEGWGTSLCWWANRIGYNDVLTAEAAKLFFDEENGLGMNIARFNIGGGDDPTHDHITRTDSMMPGYLVLNETTGEYEYDWTADENQRNVLLAINDVCDGLIAEAFSNSPPYFMTVSGCSSGNESASQDNLKEDSYGDFADYMVEVMLHYKTEWGIDFQSVDPMNEPDTKYWAAYSNKQEGCHFSSGDSQSSILTEMARALEEKGLTDVVLSASDETSIDTAITSFQKLSDEAKGVISRIDAHSYGGAMRGQLQSLAVRNEKNLWMSEVDGGDVLGENAGEMGAALWLADRIIDDMNGLMPSAWILWQAIDSHISSEGYLGRTDTGMVNTNGGYWGLAVANHDTNEIVLTKKYYAFGQFSRYIRPGYTIIASDKYSLAAYSAKEQKLVIVAVNYEADDMGVTFDLSGFTSIGESAQVIRTSGSMESGENWAELPAQGTQAHALNVYLKGNSITTYVIENVVQ